MNFLVYGELDRYTKSTSIEIECEIEILLYKGNHTTILLLPLLLVPLLLPLPPTLLFYSGKYIYIYEYYNKYWIYEPIAALLLGGQLGKRFASHDEAVVGPHIQLRTLHVQRHRKVLSGQQDVRSTAYCRDRDREGISEPHIQWKIAIHHTYIHTYTYNHWTCERMLRSSIESKMIQITYIYCTCIHTYSNTHIHIHTYMYIFIQPFASALRNW